jgi:hypothetical protein
VFLNQNCSYRLKGFLFQKSGSNFVSFYLRTGTAPFQSDEITCPPPPTQKITAVLMGGGGIFKCRRPNTYDNGFFVFILF